VSPVSRIFRLLQEGCESGVYPGAVAAFHFRNRDFLLAAGFRSLFPEREPNDESTLYDLASLTKPLATTLAVMKLLYEARLSLSTTLGSIFPEDLFLPPDKGPQKAYDLWKKITLRELLSHSAGFPAYRPYFKDLPYPPGRKNQRALLQAILAEEPVYPPGSNQLYSDLGFFLLGTVVEKVSGRPLDRLTEEIYGQFIPKEAGELVFRPLKKGIPRERLAPTEKCPFRRKVLRGEVHDENTWMIGGVSGTAGLFGTAKAVLFLLKRLLWAYHGEEERAFLNRDLLRTFWDYRRGAGTWALGFDRPSPRGSCAGPFFSRKALGHLGYTGTSFWLDPDSGRIAVLLTNRVHPSRKNQKIKTFRPRFYTEVALFDFNLKFCSALG